jgi:hypothetical protein
VATRRHGGALGLDAIHCFNLNPITGPVTRYHFGRARGFGRLCGRCVGHLVQSPGVWLGPGDGPEVHHPK